MQKNELLKKDDNIIRVFETKDENVFIIDCIKKTMPKWVSASSIADYEKCSESELLEITDMQLWDIETLDEESRRFAHEHYTWIAGVLPFISDEKQRNNVITQVAFERNISKQSIRNYLCLYLVYQDISALAPKRIFVEKKLSKDEKNMRWALNKFFYNKFSIIKIGMTHWVMPPDSAMIICQVLLLTLLLKLEQLCLSLQRYRNQLHQRLEHLHLY